MGIIESIRKRPKFGVILGSACLATAAVIFFCSRSESVSFSPPKAFYFTDDDGRTFFADDATKVAPFERNGKQVVGARVYKGKDGKLFVGYLERAASDEARKLIEKTQSELLSQAKDAPTRPDAERQQLLAQSVVVKRPGDPTWVPAASEQAARIYDVRAPDGSSPELVMP
jgi:hypothetical protein